MACATRIKDEEEKVMNEARPPKSPGVWEHCSQKNFKVAEKKLRPGKKKKYTGRTVTKQEIII